MKAMILIFSALVSTLALAADEGARYLPTSGKNVTEGHPAREKIQTVVGDFVKAMEGRDKKALRQSVTANLLEMTEWDRDMSKLPSTMAPSSVHIEDVVLMELKGMLYARFTVLDQKTGKRHQLPTDTWYRVKEEKGAWKLDAYLPNFRPDAGP